MPEALFAVVLIAGCLGSLVTLLLVGGPPDKAQAVAGVGQLVCTVILVVVTAQYVRKTQALVDETRRPNEAAEQLRVTLRHGQVILLWHELVAAQHDLQSFVQDVQSMWKPMDRLVTQVWDKVRFELCDTLGEPLTARLSSLYSQLAVIKSALPAIRRGELKDPGKFHEVAEKILGQLDECMRRLEPHRKEALAGWDECEAAWVEQAKAVTEENLGLSAE